MRPVRPGYLKNLFPVGGGPGFGVSNLLLGNGTDNLLMGDGTSVFLLP